jgi:hypothetical protein
MRMASCKKCGKQISSNYLYCYECNKNAKAYKDDNGYPRFKDSDQLVHRWTAENKLGRELRPGEVVHHKNRDKTNPNEDNIWIFRNQSEHDKTHKSDKKRYGRW